jgi:tetratricopeptide (TPR) repeat protein
VISGIGSGLRGALTGSAPPPAVPSPGPPTESDAKALIDPTINAQFAERRATIAVLKVEGPRMLRAGNWRRASELCRTWADIDLGNADAWRCLGQALQAQGYHQEAINAFRKAKQYDPADRTLDAAIDRSQRGIVADFLNRKGR